MSTTARGIPDAEAGALPIDLAVMREAAARMPAEGGGAPLSDEDLETLRLQLREHLALLVPAVEAAADGLPEGGEARRSARAFVFAARAHLRLGRGDTRLVRLSVVRKLADSVRTLCGHLERMAAS
ncbi:DUF6415 family natural product biosynthesis protein [Streptomyces ipomoeae]|uniref:DUF6415 family natural product biosynthesis protein n=1 Tax=Streptomyces ipomoeae TaxID=103232 RepID=UPI0029BC4B10|nr:DUF6415 family natural product biosynthesis protein [Streptomyces ipomoeae]MDX2694893.1 DUF6415 family natural product biosynthesis protein [Streptomyces ipomoeae]MDX2839336.1 DUF6415 family natural product biosynthesis protein [Streptomyces ipomoeae]